MLDTLIEYMSDFFRKVLTDQKFAVLTAVCFVFFVLFVGLIQMFFTKSADFNKNNPKNQLNKIAAPSLLNELVLPAEPAIILDYEPFRKTPEWNEEHMRKWFSEPDGAIFEELQRANNTILRDILGAVP